MVEIRTMKRSDWTEVGHLIHNATNTWYVNNGKAAVFGCTPEDVRFFCEVYESMDPDCCLVAEVDGRIAASCFYHPRPTHFSLGIMCVHPEFYGLGLAKKLLNKIIDLSSQAGKPLNLISSAMNLDSFSLYNKAGFVPTAVYQDMILPVPDEGLSFDDSSLKAVRPARFADIPQMVKLEKEIHGKDRGKDLQYIIANSPGIWNCHVYEEDGAISGFLCSVNHPSSKIIGPGVMNAPGACLDLIKSHLNYYKGTTPLIIAPCSQNNLVQELLKMGAKNVEMHFSQTLGGISGQATNGIIIPTFMPE